jgi:hypothetical protein
MKGLWANKPVSGQVPTPAESNAAARRAGVGEEMGILSLRQHSANNSILPALALINESAIA